MQNFSSGLPSETKTQVGGLANNIAGLLAYLPCTAVIASVVWLVTEPKSNTFLRFHALQSLFLGALLTVILIPLMIGYMIIQAIFTGMGSGLLAGLVGLIGGLLFLAVGLGVFVGYVVCMMKAYQGQMYKLPFVGELASKYAQ